MIRQKRFGCHDTDSASFGYGFDLGTSKSNELKYKVLTFKHKFLKNLRSQHRRLYHESN